MDVSLEKFLVIGAAVLFAGFLLWKYRPTLPLPRFSPSRWSSRRGARNAAALEGEIKEARERARAAKSARERAQALTAAADAAALLPEGLTSAMGLYLRAMRADATFCDPVRGVAALLRNERPELLERVLWRRLSHLPWSGETAPAVKVAAEGLVALYRHELHH